MGEQVEYSRNRGSITQIVEHLRSCNLEFIPPLDEKVQIEEYASKIFGNAVRFEAWARDELIGLVAAYFNDVTLDTAYITNVSTLPDWLGKGSASTLLAQCVGYAVESGFRCVALEVQRHNEPAMKLYRKLGFLESQSTGTTVAMRLLVTKEN